MNNNIIPACIIGAGLFAVSSGPEPAPTPQPSLLQLLRPVSLGQSNCLVSRGTSFLNVISGENVAFSSAWSDGKVEMKNGIEARNCSNPPDCGWKIISTQQMACRTDINGDGEIELEDLLAVLSQWGDQQPAQTLFNSNAGLACRMGELGPLSSHKVCNGLTSPIFDSQGRSIPKIRPYQ